MWMCARICVSKVERQNNNAIAELVRQVIAFSLPRYNKDHDVDTRHHYAPNYEHGRHSRYYERGGWTRYSRLEFVLANVSSCVSVTYNSATNPM